MAAKFTRVAAKGLEGKSPTHLMNSCTAIDKGLHPLQSNRKFKHSDHPLSLPRLELPNTTDYYA